MGCNISTSSSNNNNNNDKPDIVIKNMKDKICLLIDVAIRSDRNVIRNESKKKLKYKNLSIEIQQMWK
jgi:hypothetical protein